MLAKQCFLKINLQISEHNTSDGQNLEIEIILKEIFGVPEWLAVKDLPQLSS